ARGAAFARADEGSVPAREQHLLNPADEFCRKWVDDVGQQDADDLRALALEAPRQPVRAVVQFPDRQLHLLAHRLADVAALVDDTRDSHRRDPGPCGDVHDGRVRLPVPAFPVGFRVCHKAYGIVITRRAYTPCGSDLSTAFFRATTFRGPKPGSAC